MKLGGSLQVPWALRPEKAEAILQRIVQTTEPAEVIAFGSRVRGHIQPDSDLDLLVVLRPGQSGVGVSTRIYRAMSGLFANVDLVVVEAERWQAMRDALNTVYREAYRHGRTLYANGQLHRDALEQVSG